jgi:hypothetical protein
MIFLYDLDKQSALYSYYFLYDFKLNNFLTSHAKKKLPIF